MKQAIIILPTFNEAQNLKTLIPAVFDQQKKINNWQLSILVVDDNSPDNTTYLIKALQKKYPRLYILVGNKNGLGNAYRRGFKTAIDKYHPEVIIQMDSDWSHDPNIIPVFLKTIDNGADFVIGSRYINRGSIPDDWEWYRKLFSFCGNLVIRIGFMKLNIHDWTTGYRTIKANFIKQTLNQYHQLDGYIFQIGILDSAIKNNLNIVEIPIIFKNRLEGVSKINSFQYIFHILLYILKKSAFIKFAIVGLIGALIDFGLSFLLIERFKIAVWLTTLFSAETAIISNFLLNNFWSFSHKKIPNQLHAYLSSFLRFNFVSLGSIIIQSVLMQLAVNFLGIKYWYLYKIIIIALIIIPYSYFLYNRFIWKQDKA